MQLPLTSAQMERFEALVFQNGITRENVERFFKNPSDFLEGDGGFDLPVELGVPTIEMITACRFDYWSKVEFTPVRFPVTGSGVIVVRLHLVRLYRNTTDEEVTAELTARHLTDSGIAPLLAFAKKFPVLQRQFPIHARGSFYLDDHRLPHQRRRIQSWYSYSGHEQLAATVCLPPSDELHRKALHL